MKRDTYWTVGKETRHETRIKRCGVCGTTQARRPGERFGRCPYTYLHQNVVAEETASAQ